MEDGMKKQLIILLAASAIILSLLLVGCNSVTKIDDFKESLENAESLELKMTVSAVGMDLSYTSIMKIDGNKSYYEETGESPYYTEYSDGYLYTYTHSENSGWSKDYGKYVPESSDKGDPLSQYSFEELFNGKNYEYSKDYKVYMLKGNVDDIDLGGIVLKNVELTLKDGNCTIEAVSDFEGVPANIKLEFKNVDSTVVTLPQVGQ